MTGYLFNPQAIAVEGVSMRSKTRTNHQNGQIILLLKYLVQDFNPK